MSDIEFQSKSFDNIIGQPFFLYSDGLNEAENRSQEQFGDDRLLELLKTMGDAKAKNVVEALRVAVEEHRQGAEPNDDMTIMCLRVN